MNETETLNRLNAIFIDVLDNAEIVLHRDTTSADIREWDSLTHIHLVVSVEAHFGIRFGSKEIQNWRNVGEIVDSIVEKGSRKH